MWLPLVFPLLRTWPITQTCALTGNPTSDPLVHRPVLNPLSHTSRGIWRRFNGYSYGEGVRDAVQHQVMHRRAPRQRMLCLRGQNACGLVARQPELMKTGPFSKGVALVGASHGRICSWSLHKSSIYPQLVKSTTAFHCDICLVPCSSCQRVVEHLVNLPLGSELVFMGNIYVVLSHFWVQGVTTSSELTSGIPPPPCETCQGKRGGMPRRLGSGRWRRNKCCRPRE